MTEKTVFPPSVTFTSEEWTKLGQVQQQMVSNLYLVSDINMATGVRTFSRLRSWDNWKPKHWYMPHQYTKMHRAD